MRIDQFISGEAVDQLVESLLLVDSDGCICDANLAAEECYGYPRSQMLTMRLGDIQIPTDNGVASGCSWESDEISVVFEEDHCRCDGTSFPVEIRLTSVTADGGSAHLALVRDISVRRQGEAALRESEAKHASMICNISDVIGIMGIDGYMKYKSPNIERWFGWRPEDLVGTDGWLTVHPDDRARLQADFGALLEAPDHAAHTVEYRYLCKDGTYKWIELTATNLVDDPIIGGVLLNYRDISERKKMERLGRELSSTIDVIAKMTEMRDPYTAGHQRRVSELASAIAVDLRMNEEEVEDLRVAGLIHDIGKMSVPAELLAKPTELTHAEFALIAGHSQAGHDIIFSASMPGPIAELVFQHHERCDGSGYPRGLAATDLLAGAKVLMVADVVEAMVSHRPYRPALGLDAALAEIERGSGALYDWDVVESCARVFRKRAFEFSEV